MVPLLARLVLHGLVASEPGVTHLAIPLNTEPVLVHEQKHTVLGDVLYLLTRNSVRVCHTMAARMHK